MNKLCCNQKYPWGWMPPDYIHQLKCHYVINYQKVDHTMVDTYYCEPDFCEGAEQAYKAVFEFYSSNGDFLQKRYASPSLSIAINYLISLKPNDILLEEPRIREIKIIDDWLEENFTFHNAKMFGMWNREEMKHSVLAGVVGPEIHHIWSQHPIKQVVKTLFISEKREDVWLFERCLFDEEPTWQVKNINHIIIE